jgi:DNA replication and repair protein RecF
LDVTFQPGLVVLVGENAQGKTNLLEAIYMLATTKSQRARADSDLVSWDDRDPLSAQGFARIVGRVERGGGMQSLEILIRDGSADGQARKRFKLNGTERRAGDVLGKINAVFFSPTDVDLVAGSPSVRRRFMDVMLCQINPDYVHALNRYNRALLQRNALLRQVRDGSQSAQSLDYWDEQLCEQGSQIISWRAIAVQELASAATERHLQLSAGSEKLLVDYKPALPDLAGAPPLDLNVPLAAHRWLKQGIGLLKGREIAAGMSLAGPHRDDLTISINAVDATAFGSRGQQRTATLALKLAELAYMRHHTGDQPLLLLDDATSELDEKRRMAILAAATDSQQTFVTSADASDTVRLPSASQRWNVVGGTLRMSA